MRKGARLLRGVMAVMALLAAAEGAWQFLLPRAFFDLRWVAYLQPYNEHLMTDVGGLNLALAVVVGAAAISLDRWQVNAALVAYLIQAVTHFAFHVAHLEGFATGDAVVQTIVLGLAVVVPGLLLLLNNGPYDSGSGASHATTTEQSH